MKIPRRRFLHLGAGAAALQIVSQIARAENQPTRPPSEPGKRPLAERLAAYAYRLRYEDFDAATIERVKTHVIDTIGCGMCAWDERPVPLMSVGKCCLTAS
jgi:2-methylcitrate dehydratase